MLGVCFFVLTALSVGFALATGQVGALSNALLDGAGRAVELTLSLLGMTALFGGVMQVFRKAGAVRVLARLLAPLLRLVFPETFRRGRGREEITAAISANLLGMGNASTPLALAAMGEMQKDNPHPERATEDMVTFAVLATASPNFLPATLIALRRAAGATRPYEILSAVFITSVAGALFAVTFCRLGGFFSRTREGRGR